MNPLPIPPDPIAQPRNPKTPPGQRDPGEGQITDTWVRWLVALSQSTNDSPTRLTSPVTLTGQAGAIGTTSVVPTLTAAGLYRLTWFARITQAATVSSSLTVTLNWTDHGVGQTVSGAAMTGNTVTTWQTGSVMVYIDASLPVTYSTAYASVGATPMLYQIYVTAESVVV